ncbi:hypothetical protein [Vibrio sp. VB16]|uniref:hypothetical protein n=1 Tax=Vibrio sp. VB16 TaxID=2785746 RepID=UPI00189F1C73|nr:hypothetical protein [Vibrio sp. VB16]UGA55291.1 hypothetical protein IUZ65_002765 [Vibrio sp. VB16]
MVLLQKVSFFEAFPHIEKALNGYLWGAFQECLLHQAQCYRIDNTYLLLRIEFSQLELVVVALQGDMIVGTQAAIAHAKTLNLSSIRAHFFRRGAERFIRRKLNECAKTISITNNNEHVVRIVF